MNEKYSEYFINKFVYLTRGKVKFNVVWNTGKIQSLFSLKAKVQHLSCVIHKKLLYRNCKIKRDGHNDANENSEPVKNLARSIEHEFSWYVLTRAPESILKEFWKHTL